MTNKPKIKRKAEEKDLEEIKVAIAKKTDEIQKLQQSMAELKTKIDGKETLNKAADLDKMVNDVSGLLNIGFGMLGAPGKAQGEKSQGLVGLIDELGKLAEKSETTQRTVNLGKHGVATFSVSSRTIRDGKSSKPVSTLRITKPNQTIQKPSVNMPPAAGAIKEREPIVDVFDEETCVRVMAELPGVEENDVNLKVDGNVLVITAGNAKERAYYKKVELPAPVENEQIEYSLRNGILEAKLTKAKRRSKVKG